MWQRTVRRNNNGHPILCSSTKIEEDMPGYGDTHRCFQKYKKGYSVVTLFYKINNDISIFNKNYEMYTNKQKHHNYLDGN